MKKTFCFVVIYLGELKFFERFFSHFADEYNVHLLFIRPDDKRRRDMVDYAKEKGYQFTIIDYKLAGGIGGASIPLLSPLLRHYQHTKMCQAFLKKEGVTRLLASKTSMPIQPLFKEANYRGIETLVVQRGHMPPLDSYVEITELPFFKWLYAHSIDFLSHIVDFLFRGPRYAFTSRNPQKVGAIGEEGKTVLPERRGYDPKIIEVLGSFDYQWIIELMKKIKEDTQYRENLLRTYNINTNKKQILIAGTRYQHYIDAREKYTKEEEEENIKIFEDIISAIREVFSSDEAEIRFKLHPAEDNIYSSLEKYDVIFHGNEAKTDELLCLSDLCLAYPVTSVNYMIVASGLPGLFVNLSPLKSLNDRAVDFGITHVIDDQSELVEAFKKFRDGKLEAQYTDSVVVPNSIDMIMRFIRGH